MTLWWLKRVSVAPVNCLECIRLGSKTRFSQLREHIHIYYVYKPGHWESLCQLEPELILHSSDRSMSDEVWYFWELWGFTTAESWRSMSFSGEASQRSAAWRIRGTGYWSMTPHYVTVSIKTNDIKSGLTIKFLTQLNSFFTNKNILLPQPVLTFWKKMWK